VLRELGCGAAQQLLVLNKIDRVTDPAVFTVLAKRHPGAAFISAATGEGTGELAEAVARRAGGVPVRVTLRADCRNGRLMQYIAHHARVESQSYDGATACIEALMPTSAVDQLRSFGDDVAIQPDGR
jgi:GTP-binding protein HflX